MPVFRRLKSGVRLATAVALLAGATTGVALAQQPVRPLPQAGTIAIEPVLGTAYVAEGRWMSVKSTSTSIRFGSSSVITATLTTNSRQFDDVYNPPVRVGANLSYGLSGTAEVFGGLRYTYAKADRFDAATVEVSGNFAGSPVNAGATIKGEFDDYQDVTLEAGYRQFFAPLFGNTHPFVSVQGGIRANSQTDLTLISDDETIQGIGYYEDGVSFNFGIGVGLSFMIGGMRAGFETGLRYEDALPTDDSDLRDGEFNGLQGAGDRWEIPISFRLTIPLN